MLDEVIQGVYELRDDTTTKGITVVWKTQQPAGCTDEIFHPEDPIRAAREFNFNKTDRSKEYGFDTFYPRDVYAMKRFQASGVPILDLRMLYSRSDAHRSSRDRHGRDCLHMIYPGPLEVLAPLLQRLLREIDGVP